MTMLEFSLLDGKDGIRGKIHETDNLEKFSCYDFINIASGKDVRNVYGRNTFSYLIRKESEYHDELTKLSCNLKFSGRGQRDTPCMTMRGLQRLLMILGSKVAIEYRSLAETTFTRVIAGDRTLIKTIEANAQSTAPINKAFRDALVKNPLPGDDALDRMMLTKKHKYDELEYDERVEALELKRTERIKMQIDCIKNQVDLYKILSPNGVIDERAQLLFRDSVLNGYLVRVQAATNNDDNLPVTISTIATEMGLTFSSNEYIRIGIKVRQAYFNAYGKEPTKHDQLCGGAVRKVCSYTKKDTALIQEVLRTFTAT